MNMFKNITTGLTYLWNFIAIRIFQKEKYSGNNSLNSSKNIWNMLVESEAQIIDFMEQKVAEKKLSGSAELGLVLHWLNYDTIFVVKVVFKLFGMPASKVTPETLAAWKKEIYGAEITSGSGMFISFRKFELFDLKWLEVIKNYIEVHLGIKKLSKFHTTPTYADYSSTSPVSINIVGDFGTGAWKDDNQPHCPAELIQMQMAENQGSVHIHLGDIYYSGTTKEAKNGFLKTWTPGKIASYNMNGNHDLYSGDSGYFEVTLKDDAFKAQNNTSYYSFKVNNWLFLGLDTSYFSNVFFCSEGRITDPDQIAFMKEKIAGHAGKIALITHHGPVSSTGNEKFDLWDDVVKIMGNSMPDLWYYGHIHNAMVFNSTVLGDVKTKFRCIGNGALPYGKGYELEAELGKKIAWLPNKPLSNPSQFQNKRLLNTYLNLTIDGDTISETIIYQDGTKGYVNTI